MQTLLVDRHGSRYRRARAGLVFGRAAACLVDLGEEIGIVDGFVALAVGDDDIEARQRI